MTTRLPTYFISHGGGPWPWLPNLRSALSTLETSLVEMVKSWDKTPSAILMISGHWESDHVEIMGASQPPMLYDYYGFPEETYKITYPAPGSPTLANKVHELLTSAGIPSTINRERGFDHGTFSPLQIMYPQANVPVIQVSLLKHYDPKMHFNIGRALSSLRDEGVMIIGSGLSYHNLRLMGPEGAAPSAAFDEWLQFALTQTPEKRIELLSRWTDAPHARTCHPREDHLVPLFVALGAAEQGSVQQIYSDTAFKSNISVSSYRFD